MGYSLTQKGYILYDLLFKSFFKSRNAVFEESVFPFLHAKSVGTSLFPVIKLLHSELTTDHSSKETITLNLGRGRSLLIISQSLSI